MSAQPTPFFTQSASLLPSTPILSRVNYGVSNGQSTVFPRQAQFGTLHTHVTTTAALGRDIRPLTPPSSSNIPSRPSRRPKIHAGCRHASRRHSHIHDRRGAKASLPNRETMCSSSVDFNGTHVSKTSDSYKDDQNEYSSALEENLLRTPGGFAMASAKASYVSALRRPEQVCPINVASQIMAERMQPEDAKALVAALKAVKKSCALNSPRMDIATLCLRVYANFSDQQLGPHFAVRVRHILGRRHKQMRLVGLVQPEVQASNNIQNGRRRVSFCAGLEAGFALRHLIHNMLQREFSLQLCTDSQTTWDSVMSLWATTEKRLLVYISRSANPFAPA